MSRDVQEQLQRTLGDAYRIERELGGGGMSRVFVALETALQRKVVVKVLLPELAAGVSVERFRREIYLAAQLQHPHIVPLLSAGESEGLPYFTMPYVDGESLRARLLRERELPVAQAVRMLRDVAAALAYAHERGVVHRDIKPDNVLLSRGIAVVTDFGVAKAVTASSEEEFRGSSPGLTSRGVTLGTPHYMAPEQGTGDPAMDHRVDIYAFGATAYEILSGDPPFTGNSPHAILGAHLATPAKPIASIRPGLPPLLAHVVMQCLEKRPADRPQSADEIIRVLDSLTTPTGGTVPLSMPRTEVIRARGAGVRRFVLPATAAALAAAVAILAWPRSGAAPDRPATTAESTAALPKPEPAVPSAAVPSPPAAPASLDTFKAETARAPARARTPAPAAGSAESRGCGAARPAPRRCDGRARARGGFGSERLDSRPGRLGGGARQGAGAAAAYRRGGGAALGRGHAVVGGGSARGRGSTGTSRHRGAAGHATDCPPPPCRPVASLSTGARLATGRAADPRAIHRVRRSDRVSQRRRHPAGLSRADRGSGAGVAGVFSGSERRAGGAERHRSADQRRCGGRAAGRRLRLQQPEHAEGAAGAGFLPGDAGAERWAVADRVVEVS